MDGTVIASIIGAILGAGGLAWSTKIKTKAGDAASSVESALKLQQRYEDINETLTEDMKKLKDETDEKIRNLTTEFQREIKEIKKGFEHKENYYQSEIEKRDDRIDDLEDIVMVKDKKIEEQAAVIAKYEGGI